MANLGDLWKDITGKENHVIDGIGDIFGTLADFGGAFGTLQLLGLFSQDDALAQVLQEIRDLFNQLSELILAEDKLERMRNIDSIFDPAFRVFRQLPAILSSGPHPHEYILEQIGVCQQAILSLANDVNKWQAVKGELPTYSDTWSGTLAPQPGSDPLTSGGLVFNYTYTLPQFLRTIYIFLTVVHALDPPSLNDYQQDLNDCITRLQSVHDTIVSSGIVGTKMPDIADVGAIDADAENHLTWSFDWASDLIWPYGAVEIYTAVSNVSSYTSTDWGNILWSVSLLDGLGDQNRNNFFNLLKLRIIRKKKELYRELGMPVIRRVINQLRLLTGQPLLTDAPYEAWSVGEVSSILDVPLPADLSGVEPALATFLGETPPYTGFWMLDRKDNPDGEGFINFKRWVPAFPLPTGMPLFGFLTGAYVTFGRNSGFLIQSRHGVRGNFELVVPLATGGLALFFRDNDAPGLPWHGPSLFGQAAGQFAAVSLIESNFSASGNGPGNLELVVRTQDGRLLESFQPDTGGPNNTPGPWQEPFALVADGRPVTGVTEI